MTAIKAGYDIIHITDTDLKSKGMSTFDEKLKEYVTRRTEGIRSLSSTGDDNL
jgi:hypothetical protein